MYPARPTLLVILGFSSLAILSGPAVSSSPTVTHASPQTPAGKQQFISRCAACHGEDGHGGQLGPNIIDVANPRAASADAVRGLIRSGIPSAGMPAFATLSDAEVAAIAAYVMSLKTPRPGGNTIARPPRTVPGDVTAGFRYFTNQGNCASCHAIRGRGGVVGPDLVSVGQTRTAAQIEQALLNPGSFPQPQNSLRRRRWRRLKGTELPLPTPPPPSTSTKANPSAASSAAKQTSTSNSWPSTATSTCSPKTKSPTSRATPNP